MILIADSGSTKTAWRLVDGNGRIHQIETQGFNPFFQDTGDIVRIINEEFFHQVPKEVKLDQPEIHFYGAGCSSESRNNIVKDALEEVFEGAKIEVNHDMLAAARAVCGHKPGIAAILGTGSNSCLYDGEKIVRNIPALGFILGDEGSGANIGKSFIKDYLNEEVPKGISERFFTRYKFSKDEILEAVYKKPFPNRFLAQFSKFVYQNLKEEYMASLVASCFSAFFEKHICKYPGYKELKMGVVGSVGFYFSNILRRVAENHGVEIETIIESPIAGLTLFHLEKGFES